jgi:copper chaperone CopZ
VQHLAIPIAGMSCDGCVRHVRDALTKLPGVRVDEVTVGQAVVTFDPAVTSPQALTAAITQAGYGPSPGLA